MMIITSEIEKTPNRASTINMFCIIGSSSDQRRDVSATHMYFHLNVLALGIRIHRRHICEALAHLL